jgi:hypothetical protein
MHFFGFTVSDEVGTSMAAGKRSAIPPDRYGNPPRARPRLPRDAPWQIIAAIGGAKKVRIDPRAASAARYALPRLDRRTEPGF